MEFLTDEQIRSLTPEQIDARMAMLDCELANYGSLTIDFFLPELNDDQLWKLGEWGQRAIEYAPVFGDWLLSLAAKEFYRRHEDSPFEGGNPEFPSRWTDAELSVSLTALSGMLAANRDSDLDRFFKKLNVVVAAIVAGHLKEKP
mgnify:CR=1 FL=1